MYSPVCEYITLEPKEEKYIKVEKIKDNTEDWRVTYIDKEFYMSLQEILYISYVNI